MILTSFPPLAPINFEWISYERTHKINSICTKGKQNKKKPNLMDVWHWSMARPLQIRRVFAEQIIQNSLNGKLNYCCQRQPKREQRENFICRCFYNSPQRNSNSIVLNNFRPNAFTLRRTNSPLFFIAFFPIHLM